jgi:hypothetical protein
VVELERMIIKINKKWERERESERGGE